MMAVLPAPSAGRVFRSISFILLVTMLSVAQALAAPYAALVMDARTGEVLKADNADTRLHPASLTKMMTLYITFEAIKRGEISLDTVVTVSSHAASEPPSKLGLRAGQKIKLRYLIRAAAIKSANDCATALGEALEGSEAAFARRMNRTAKALGMTRTTFKNANGLTESGHLSTARDMSILGRHLLYDHPEYYNLFSRRTSDAGGRTVANTNTRFLDAYPGADGIKTGYTVAAGFNLVASAVHGDERIIATVFGGTSTVARNKKVAELLDFGFKKAPSQVREKKPPPPAYADVEDDPAVAAGIASAAGAVGKTIRLSGAPLRSLRPLGRPQAPDPEVAPELIAAIEDGVAGTLAAVQEEAEAVAPTGAAPVLTAAAPPRPERDDAVEAPEVQVAEAEVVAADPESEEIAAAEVEAEVVDEGEPVNPAAAAVELALAEALPELVTDGPEPESEGEAEEMLAEVKDVPEVGDEVQLASVDPAAEAGEEPVLTAEAGDIEGDVLTGAHPPVDEEVPATVALAALKVLPEVFPEDSAVPVVVTRLSTSGGRNWGINVGTYPSQYEAEKVLLKTALMEIGTLDEALRKVARTKRGFEANFLGMTEDLAGLACLRLAARNIGCTTLGPDS